MVLKTGPEAKLDLPLVLGFYRFFPVFTGFSIESVESVGLI